MKLNQNLLNLFDFILKKLQLVKSFKIECINKDQVELILHLISVPSKSIKLKLTERT